MRDLEHLIDAAELHMLVAEVELVALARREALRDAQCAQCLAAAFKFALVSAHRVDRAVSRYSSVRVSSRRRRILPIVSTRNTNVATHWRNGQHVTTSRGRGCQRVARAGAVQCHDSVDDTDADDFP